MQSIGIIDAHKGRCKNRVADTCRRDLSFKTPLLGAFWRTYSARAYIMVSLSYTSRREVRQDPITGTNKERLK